MTKKVKRIYLDHAATTYIDPRVSRAMFQYFSKNFGNASALYEEGRIAKSVLGESRKKIAELISASPEEIIFTSGGTESNNLAIQGIINYWTETKSLQDFKPHIITLNIEHHSVLHLVEALEKNGKVEATYIKVKQNGIVEPQDIEKALKKNTVLVSVMYANNEIGTIQPISEIARIIRKFQSPISNFQPPFFHTDACQTAEYLEMNVQKLGVDLMTMNGSKIYGPKGVGFLYIKKGINLSPIFLGGGQEFGTRPGTENIAGIVGLAKAFEIASKEKEKELQRLRALRDYFIKKLHEKIPNIVLNGDPVLRLPNNVNISILGIEGESALLYLDEKGVSVATGSACTSESLEPSHVIIALGRSYEYSHGSLRFSLGKKTIKKDLDYVLKILPPIVEKLRRLSPIDFKELAIKIPSPKAPGEIK